MSNREKAVIVCNGEVAGHESEVRWLTQASLIVAADGGLRHVLGLGFAPHAVVGDLDSAGGEGLAQLPPGTEVLAFPRDKDETDAELALRYAAGRGFRQVVFLGALGGRLDHALGNLFLLTRAVREGLEARIVDGSQEVYLLDAAEAPKLELRGQPGDLVSLIPITETTGITTHGLKYPLRSEGLVTGSTRGISNEFVGDAAAVSCEGGSALVVYTSRGY